MPLTKIKSLGITDGTILGTDVNSTFDLTGKTVTLPAGTGGKVLQVITATDSTERSTSTTSYVTASNTLSVNITPSSASNKIFVIAHTNCYGDSSNTNIYYTIFRDSTNLGSSIDGMLALHKPQYTTSYNTASHPACMTILDTPNTTSQITYQVYIKPTGGTGYINYHNGKSVITAFEIAG